MPLADRIPENLQGNRQKWLGSVADPNSSMEWYPKRRTQISVLENLQGNKATMEECRSSQFDGMISKKGEDKDPDNNSHVLTGHLISTLYRGDGWHYFARHLSQPV